MAIAGFGGQVRVSTNVALDVTKWEGEFGRAELESTALNPTGEARTYVMGLFEATASIEANYNMGDTDGQLALHAACFAGTSVTLNLDTADSGTNRTYSGTAFITKVKPAVAVDDLVTISFDVRFSGLPTFA